MQQHRRYWKDERLKEVQVDGAVVSAVEQCGWRQIVKFELRLEILQVYNKTKCSILYQIFILVMKMD